MLLRQGRGATRTTLHFDCDGDKVVDHKVKLAFGASICDPQHPCDKAVGKVVHVNPDGSEAFMCRIKGFQVDPAECLPAN